jgi:molybdopterin biosynthesis enzyme
VLTAPAKAAADRPVYLPCRLEQSADGLAATPLPWTGSSDLLGLAGAQGLVALAAGGGRHEAGALVEVVLRW